MNHKNTRRKYLTSLGTTAILALAGCSSDNGTTVQTDDTQAEGEGDTDLEATDATEGASEQSSEQLGSAGDWPMLRRDPANTGYVPENLGLSNGVGLEQTYQIDTSVSWTPVVSDNSIYYVDGDIRQLHAIDRAEGDERWSTERDDKGRAFRTPAFANNTIVAGFEGGLFAFETTSGNIKWEHKTGGSFGAPIITNGRVYSASSKVHAFDLNSGDELWSYDEEPLTEFSIHNNRAYVPIADGFSCLNIDDGTEHWSVDVSDGDQFGPSVVYQDMLFGILSDSELLNQRVLALDTADGKELWRAKTDSLGWPAVADGTVYAPGPAKLFAFSTDNGSKEWEIEQVNNGAPVVVDDTVLVADSRNGDLVGISRDNGEKLWSVSLGRTSFQRVPEITVAGGNIYIMGREGGNNKILSFSRQ